MPGHSNAPLLPTLDCRTPTFDCIFLIIAAGLAAAAGAVMLFLKKQLGQFVILGGGLVMLVLSTSCEARYGATGRLTYDLVAGFVIAAAGGLMLIPAFRMTLAYRQARRAGLRPVDSRAAGNGRRTASRNHPSKARPARAAIRRRIGESLAASTSPVEGAVTATTPLPITSMDLGKLRR